MQDRQNRMCARRACTRPNPFSCSRPKGRGRLRALLSLAAALCLIVPAGCSDAATVPETVSETAYLSTQPETIVPTTAAPLVIPGDLPPVDVDLSGLSRTLMYAQAYDMVYSPDDYKGKTVRMRGPVDSYADETTGEMHYVCIIEDATACCTQGIEFELEDDEAYPPSGSEALVSGTFDFYLRDDLFLICVLHDATVEAV